jgi:hypothetical protein
MLNTRRDAIALSHMSVRKWIGIIDIALPVVTSRSIIAGFACAPRYK